jgi:hypothetical protein
MAAVARTSQMAAITKPNMTCRVTCGMKRPAPTKVEFTFSLYFNTNTNENDSHSVLNKWKRKDQAVPAADFIGSSQ